MKTYVRDLHEAVLDLVGILNEPHRDDILIAAAGIALDRALFPLLVRIGKKAPIGVVRLAEISGRDYTTVSRQVAKLESLGLVTRRASKTDKRLHEAALTAKGMEMNKAVDKAREALLGPKLSQWSERDRAQLVRLLQKLVNDARN